MLVETLASYARVSQDWPPVTDEARSPRTGQKALPIMATQTTTEIATGNQTIKMVAKLSMATIGVNPKRVAGMDDANARIFLCNIYGMADGIKVVEDKNQAKIFHALVGRFQAERADSVLVRSGVLYFPSGIQETYLAAVKGLEEGDTLQFAVAVYAVKSTNLAGYSYEAVELQIPTSNDPLTQFAEQVKIDRARLLEAGKVAALPASTPAPEKPAAGKGKPGKR